MWFTPVSRDTFRYQIMMGTARIKTNVPAPFTTHAGTVENALTRLGVIRMFLAALLMYGPFMSSKERCHGSQST